MTLRINKLKYIFNLFMMILLTNLCLSVNASGQQNLTLSDGSVIKGRLIDIEDGVYLIQTEALGELRIPESQVINISSQALPLNPSPLPSNNQTNFLSQLGLPSLNPGSLPLNLLSDPQLMQDMQKLMQDPAMQQILFDPQIQQVLLSQDPEKIQSNPKIQQLLQNPVMQNIIQKIQQGLPAPGTTAPPVPNFEISPK